MRKPRFTVDSEAEVVYISLNDEAVTKTVSMSDDVLVDLDVHGVVVGIEILDFDAEIPYQELTVKCHVHSDVVDEIRRVQPTFRDYLVSITHSNDGVLAPNSSKVTPNNPKLTLA